MIYFLILIITYLVAVIAFYLFSDLVIFNRLHYKPSYKNIDNLIQLSNGSVAVYLENKRAKGTILYCHGNDEDIANTYWFLEELYKHELSVFMLDYRGFGASCGIPSESNSYKDVTIAYQYLTETLQVNPQSIILFGRSLGSGPAVELACTNQVAGIILEGAFVSAYRVITYLPLLPFDKYKNLKKLQHLSHIPLLVFHGTNDLVVPVYHGKKLASLSQASAESLIISGAGHSNLLQTAGQQYWQAITNFLYSLQ